MNKGWVTFAVVLVLDQVSKYLAARANLGSINSGISFGFLSGMSPLLVTILVLVFLVAIFWQGKLTGLKDSLAGGLIFGGAVSNILDRMVFGGVRDWLPIPFLNVHNNVADWAIFIGLVMAGIVELKAARQRKE